MKQIVTLLGLISAITAVVLAVTSFSNMAYIPAILALVLGALSFFISKQKSKKAVQLIFLLTILSLSLTIYKSIYSEEEPSEVDQLEDVENLQIKSATDSIDVQ
ncbi:hypothetical protein [Sediminibacter sp. Hel_I_10]|uniref:hypothetical protein n=1 Tax=Sediminibacter sp. Hel_I_10 TaxID=1392490 RepID=UPI00047E9789|nr:hypothetical protein [Sediminibacter sp. Hel_I_10]